MTDDGLSVVVCTANGRGRIERFLGPLARVVRASPFPTELLLIDDGSTDGTATAVRGAVPDAVVVSHEQNRGLPAARNTAITVARHDWLLYCDDDVEIPTDALAQLWDARNRGRCIVPELRGPSGELQNAVVASWHLGDRKLRYSATPIARVAYPVGACFLIHRDTAVLAGGFDERFHLYYEDVDFGAALERVDVSVIMLQGTRCVHHLHGSGVLSQKRAASIAGQVYEARWRFGLGLHGWRAALLMFSGLPRVCRESVMKRHPGPLRGYFRAIRDAPRMLRHRSQYDLRSRTY